MIRNRDALATSDAHDVALTCVEAGVRAADPRRCTETALAVGGGVLSIGGDTFRLDDYDRLLVLGGGKAAGGVVRALDGLLGDRIDEGLVVVPADEAGQVGNVELTPGGHPVPTEEGAAATRRLLDLVDGADERTLVLAVVTGGASALLCAPAGEISVADLQETTRALLDAGADIGEVNAVRTQCSTVKGGQLATAAAPATVLGLLFSDVVGDDPTVVGSGPTAPAASTAAEAVAVLDRHDVTVPATVRDALESAARDENEGEPPVRALDHVRNHVIASNRTALEAAARAADERGYTPCILSSRVRGEARESARTHVAVAEEVVAEGDPVNPPAVLLSGGETTVRVSGDGTGGPNLEFGLAAAVELGAPAVVAAVDTDGLDGSTDAAGALADVDTVRGRESISAARRALADNDALPFLDERGAAIRTGATGTNVNDLRVLVVPSAGLARAG